MTKQSVVLPWLAEHCSLKQQTVVLVALRGCDGLPKEDPSKPLVRALRATVLRNADDSTSFMDLLRDEFVADFLESVDHYPLHWYTHFMHAAAIVGFKHPDAGPALYWRNLYVGMANALHLQPESEVDLDRRLWP